MAIEVITHGQPKLIATCSKCGCTFSFLATDMEDYGNQLDWYETIHCPDCHNKLTWYYGSKSGRTRQVDYQPYKGRI